MQTEESRNDWLRASLELGQNEIPDTWQNRLLDEFINGGTPSAFDILDIPTGLVKSIGDRQLELETRKPCNAWKRDSGPQASWPSSVSTPKSRDSQPRVVREARW